MTKQLVILTNLPELVPDRISSGFRPAVTGNVIQLTKIISELFMNKTIATVFMLLSLSAAASQAQQFKIEDLGVLLGGPERGIDMNTKGLILAEARVDNGEGGTKKCPFLFDPSSNKVTNLCEQGLVEAYDLNNKGDVAGVCLDPQSSNRNKRRACVWRFGHGTKRLGLINDDDTYSVALGLNDRGIVVGYSGHGGILVPNYYTALSYNLKKNKLVDPFRFSQRNTVAFKVSNRGLIVGGVDSGSTFGEMYNSLTFPVIKRRSGRARVRHSNLSISYVATSEAPEAVSRTVAINERKQLVINFFRVNLATGVEKDTIPKLRNSRYDYGSSSAINDIGNVAGWAGSTGYLYTDRRADNTINCLFPRNEKPFGKPALTISDFTVSDVSALDDNNRLLVTADLMGDGLPEHLFIVSQLPESEFGRFFSFCPFLWVDEVAGQEPCGSDETIPNGTQCQAEIHLVERYGSTEPLAGVRVEIQSEDPTGPDGEACEINVLSNPIVGIDGTRIFNFTKDSRRSLRVVGPIDERFLTEVAPVLDNALNGDGLLSSPWDDHVGICYNND